MSGNGQLRVAYLIHEMKTGGTQRQLEGLLSRLPAEIAPRLYCLTASGKIGERLRAAGVSVRAYGLENLWTLRGYRAVRELSRDLRGDGTDLVHAFLGTANLIAPRLGHTLGVPAITSRRDTGFWMSRRFRWLARLVANRAAAVTVNSEAVRRSAVSLEGVRPEKILLVPNAVDIPAPLPPEERNATRNALGVVAEETLLITVATLLEVKDHRTALAAAARLRREGMRFKWIFAGAGPEEAPLRRQAREDGVEENILFLGDRDDAGRLLQSADVFVLTSRSEGFPNALLEAMASGLPAVATDCGGVREMAEGGRECLFAPVGGAAEIAACVLRLMSDPGAATELGAAARARAARDFSWEKLLETTLALYRRLSGAEGRG